jgi:hypothetical protein
MSYPQFDPAPAPSPGQDEIDAATRRRTLDALIRCLARLGGAIAQDWRHCGKSACRRARRCRGFACEEEFEDALEEAT